MVIGPFLKGRIQKTLANRFQRSFSEKIDALLCNLFRQPVDELSTDVTSPLMCFEAASPTDVKRMVLASAAKSYELDPLPSSLMKRYVDVLSQVLARIINASLSSSVVPPSMKHAVVIPVLKKGVNGMSYDVNGVSIYRPTSNISFAASDSSHSNYNTSSMKTAYMHSTRMSFDHALLRIHNDVAQSIDARRGVLLVLLDLSAAFDTLDHGLVLRRLHGCGICGDAHAWLASYLQGRTFYGTRQESSVFRNGVPQGSVLGSILFNIYIAPLAKLLQQHGIQHHLYADNTQLYVDFPPTKHADALARM